VDILPVALGHDPTASLCPWVQVTRSTADYPSRKAQIAVALLNGTLPPTNDVVDLMYRCDGLCRCQPQPSQPAPTPYTNLIHDARAALVARGHVAPAEEWAANWRDHGNIYGTIGIDASLLDRGSADNAVLYVPGAASLYFDPAAVAANLRLLKVVLPSVAIRPEILDSGYVLCELGLHTEWETERQRVREIVLQGGYQSIVTTNCCEAMGLATALQEPSITISSVLDAIEPATFRSEIRLRPPDPEKTITLHPTEEMIREQKSLIALSEMLASWSGYDLVVQGLETTWPVAIERPMLPSTEQLARRLAETRARELLRFHEGEDLMVLTIDPFSKCALSDQFGDGATVMNVATFLCDHLEGEHANA